MNKFSAVVREYLSKNHLKQKDIADNCSSSEGAISQLLRNDGISLNKMEMIAEALNCELDIQLVDKIKTVPIKCSIHKVSAGEGYYLDDDTWKTIHAPDTPVARKADFALEIEGDSMEPKYSDGDIVFVIQTPAVDEGNIAIYAVNNKGYIKRYEGDRLVSLNPKYDDIMFCDYDPDEIYCLGLVIGKV